MSRQLRERHISGVNYPTVREYEARHRKIAKKAAASGVVLLKNEDSILPISEGSKVALYGTGAIHMIKGGTGSGDVNEREVIDIKEGLVRAGFKLANAQWLDDYKALYEKERVIWRDKLLAMSHEPDAESLFAIYAANPMQCPLGETPQSADADIAIFVLSRVAGEGADRYNNEGDYLIRQDEYDFLKTLCKLYPHVILLINTGGTVDLGFMDEISGIDAALYIVQPGMEGGSAVADILLGKSVPCGKLTDSWAYNYMDFPNSATFSHNGGGTDKELYSDGIYVGYRYFDSFDVPVRYGFGFGLSYTSFDIQTLDVRARANYDGDVDIRVKVKVTNTGDKYSGREVVQIYVSCPDGILEKEYRRLVGFKKTKLLAPAESEEIEISFPMYSCASYDEKLPGYILEKGYYGIWVGNSLGESKLRTMLHMEKGAVCVRTEHVCPIKEKLEEISVSAQKRETRYRSWVNLGNDKKLPIVDINASDIVEKSIEYGVADNYIDEEARAFIDSLSDEQIIKLACGDPVKSQDNNENYLGQAGMSVPGSAAETSRCAVEQGLGSMVLSDGPAGLRLDREYRVTKNGEVRHKTFIEILENGFFNEKPLETDESDTVYYQYCTAFPVGIMLAQTWDEELIREVGVAVGEEMMEFQTALWLAPGMNIHRNPLCGRNFEYYSEDPVISGITAAAMTQGVQSIPGCGTTIKHFACNNNEENRMHCDSIVNERALREIYLKGFEIAVKSSKPKSIMTSYNLINGVHTANSHDLCMTIARDEWGFDGVIMTDWTTTEWGDDCTASGCMRAGNDLVCPGSVKDFDNIHKELEEGTLTMEAIKRCTTRYVRAVWRSNAYVNPDET